MDPGTASGEVTRTAAALEARPGFPSEYVERARAAAAALSPAEMEDEEPADDEVAAAGRLLGRTAGAPVDPAKAPSAVVARPTRRVVGKLVHWYLGFLGPRAADLGRAAANLGVAVTDRLDHVEARRWARRQALRAEFDALRARVEELEQRR